MDQSRNGSASVNGVGLSILASPPKPLPVNVLIRRPQRAAASGLRIFTIYHRFINSSVKPRIAAYPVPQECTVSVPKGIGVGAITCAVSERDRIFPLLVCLGRDLCMDR